MTEQVSTKIFWDSSVNDHHWITGQAYPPSEKKHYHPAYPQVIEFPADAHAVYRAERDSNNESWGVALTTAHVGEPDYFVLPGSPNSEDQFDMLVDAVESRLGRTGLNILIY